MKKMYGTLPQDLGKVDISPDEMMAWLYCPISLKGTFEIQIPDNLAWTRPILRKAFDSLEGDEWRERNIYLTAKTLWVTPESPGNRPGWHSDGFMTDDINIIWSDRNPTLFWECKPQWPFTQDHDIAMREMATAIAEEGNIVTFPDKHVLRLDERHIHAVDQNFESGMRTFVKVSASKHTYAHVGNSINHKLNHPRPSVTRAVERNCPATS